MGLVEGDFTRSHLLSSTSTGRWQLWTAAADEWETKPALGRGAGSYQSWWMEHASLPLFVRDAHSLWLEMLGELGVVGLLLLVIAFGAGFVAGLSRRMGRLGPARPLVAALAGVLAAFVVAAGDRLDVGADDRRPGGRGGARDAGRARDRACRPRPAVGSRPVGRRQSARRGRVLRTAGVGVALAAIMCVAVPMLAQKRLEDSQAAAARGDVAGAIDAADDARAAGAMGVLAVPAARAGRGAGRAISATANRHIKDALERDSSDWSTWLVAARVQTKAGFIRRGAAACDRPSALNRRSQLFEALRDSTSKSSARS